MNKYTKNKLRRMANLIIALDENFEILQEIEIDPTDNSAVYLLVKESLGLAEIIAGEDFN